ncbi:hypothetical protein FRC06_010491 [Ceratobasidium sp. 370]|nr:hypothetical protein FRC06_010491 [Ceratobasidium sp. 370]
MPDEESKDVHAQWFRLQQKATILDKIWDKLVEEEAVVWDDSKVLGVEVFNLDDIEETPVPSKQAKQWSNAQFGCM